LADGWYFFLGNFRVDGIKIALDVELIEFNKFLIKFLIRIIYVKYIFNMDTIFELIGLLFDRFLYIIYKPLEFLYILLENIFTIL
jgi:hypothetical protein